MQEKLKGLSQASITDSVNSYFQISIIYSKYLKDGMLWVSSSTSLFSSLSMEFPFGKKSRGRNNRV